MQIEYRDYSEIWLSKVIWMVCAVEKIPFKICHAMCLPEGGSNLQNGPALRCTKIYITFKVQPKKQYNLEM